MEVQDPGPGCIDFSSWVTHAPLMFQAETSPSVSTVGYWLTLQASYGYTWTVFLGQISHPRNVFLKEREREYDMPSLQKTCSITTLKHHARPRAAMRTHSELHLSTNLPSSSTVCEAPSGFAACAWIFRISVCHALTLCSLWLSSGCQVSCDRLQTNIDWVVQGLQVVSSLVSFIVYSEHERERERERCKKVTQCFRKTSIIHAFTDFPADGYRCNINSQSRLNVSFHTDYSCPSIVFQSSCLFYLSSSTPRHVWLREKEEELRIEKRRPSAVMPPLPTLLRFSLCRSVAEGLQPACRWHRVCAEHNANGSRRYTRRMPRSRSYGGSVLHPVYVSW